MQLFFRAEDDIMTGRKDRLFSAFLWERREGMERKRSFSDYALCFVSSMALHLHWLLPAVLLTAAHFVFGIPILWAAGAFLLFLLTILFRTLVIGWAAGCRQTACQEKQNRNPYSAGPYRPLTARAPAGREESEI